MAELSKYAEEIMVEILSRLLPKSLMRLKCVRKSWQCLINNSDFAAKHLSVSKHNSITIVFQRLVPEDDVHSSKTDLLLMLFDLYHHGLDGDDGDHKLHPTFEDLYTPFSSDLVDCQLFCVSTTAHCDGILCLSDHKSYIVFCNPAIREFKLLHVPSSYSGSHGDGFGYDLKSKDYKFVRIVDQGQEVYQSGDRITRVRVVMHPPTAVVYSLLTSSWKEIEADNLITKFTIYFPASNSIYLNGILYWLGCEQLREERTTYSEYGSEEEVDDHSGLKECLISFDMGNEAFHVILLPEAFRDLSRCGFGVFNEAIACCPGREIWLMEDLGGGEGSWTKYLTFEPVVDGVTHRVGLFSYNKQLVVVMRTMSAIVFQEVCTNQFKLLPMKTWITLTAPHYSGSCTSSIVSINGGTRQLDSHDNAKT